MFIHSFLFHTVMIRTGCFDQGNFSVFDLADIGVSDMYDLILGKRISSEFFSVNGNMDRIMGTFPRNLKTKPENPRQNQDPGNENHFFFLRDKNSVSVTDSEKIISYSHSKGKYKLRISNQYLEKLQQKLKIRRKKLPRTNKKYRQEKNQVI